MSRTLKLIDHLLARARHLQKLGRSTDALELLGHLEEFRDLPSRFLVDTQFQLADFCLSRRKYVRARRHLKAALKHEPANAHCHFLLATALSSGRNADPQDALKHFLLSLDLEPDQPKCMAACGALEIRQGMKKVGLKHLRRAAELAPDDAEVIRQVVTGLRLANETGEARGLLLAARFRNPGSPEFQGLWNDFYFHRARKAQQLAKTRSAAPQKYEEPVILPFIRLISEQETSQQPRKIIRKDGSGKMAPPRGDLRVLRPDQRHAQ